MICKQCETDFKGRSDAQYCSIKCKQKAYRIRQIRALNGDFEYLSNAIKAIHPDGNTTIELRLAELRKKLDNLK